MRFKQMPINGLKKRSRQSYRDLNACQGVDRLLPTEFSAQNSKLTYPFWILRKRREKPLFPKMEIYAQSRSIERTRLIVRVQRMLWKINSHLRKRGSI